MTVEVTMVLMKPVTHAQIMRTNFVDKWQTVKIDFVSIQLQMDMYM